MPDADALEIIRNIDFLKEMNRLGLGVALDQYKDAYSQIMRDYQGVVKMVTTPNAVKELVEIVKVLNKAADNG